MSNNEWDHGRGRGRNDGDSDRAVSGITPLKSWKIRFDAPPGDALLRVAEEGDILALFRAWDASTRQLAPHVHVYYPDKDQDPGNERRGNPRYLPAETRAWIGWWHGSRFIVAPSELVNLSKGGALIFQDERPPMGQPIWLCLGAPHPLEYVQARVLDATPRPGSSSYCVRLDFHIPCPLSFFVAAGHRFATT